MWGKIRKVLGFLTDVLLAGRERGWWERGQGIEVRGEEKGDEIDRERRR